MMYATAKEGGNTRAAYTQLFLSAAATGSAGIFLAIYGVREGFLRGEKFLQGTVVQQLDLL